MRWVRAAELSCDRAALIVAGDPKVVVSVLMKLSGGCPKLSGQLNVDAFLDQARRYVYMIIVIRVFMGNWFDGVFFTGTMTNRLRPSGGTYGTLRRGS